MDRDARGAASHATVEAPQASPRPSGGRTRPANARGSERGAVALLLVGGGFLAAGAAILALSFVLGASGEEVMELRNVSSEDWSSLEPGTRVRVQGRIADSQPAELESLVVYRRYEYRPPRRRTGQRKRTRERWDHDGTVTPPLMLEVPGGTVRIVNQGYDLQGVTHTVDEDEEGVAMAGATKVATWDDVTAKGSERFVGLTVGAPVLAVGAVVQQPEPGLRAEWISPGDGRTYARKTGQARILGSALGALFLIAGGALTVVGIRKQQRKDSY